MEKKFLSSKEGTRYKEQILDETSGRIERDLEAAKAARKIFADALAGKSVLLVDSVLGKIDQGSKKAISELHDRGWDELTQLILQKAFGGRIPGHTDFFQKLFGEDIKMDVVDIRERKRAPEATNIGVFVFSGSPANVSDALVRPKEKAWEGYTHGFVYDVTTQLYRKAQEKKSSYYWYLLRSSNY